MAGPNYRTLRFSPLESKRVMVALLISLLLHVTGWSAYEAGKKFGIWDRLRALLPAHVAKPNPPPALPVPDQERQIFVDVSHPETEPPKNTVYYSDQNSVAANPNPAVDSNQPKLDGKVKDSAKTEDVERTSKLQPSPPPAQPQPPAPPQPQPPAESPDNLGDVKLAKKETPKPEQQQPQPKPPTQERPRTIKEALAQQHQMPGRAMQQDGGVRRQRLWSSLDVRATPFGEYDRAIVESVTQHWYDLLDSHRYALDRTGRVTIHFKLMSDGSIQELSFVSNDAGATLGYLCEDSIMEAAPFAKWPPDMRRMIGENFRDITFTFIY